MARNTGCPLSAKLSIIPSAVLSYSPSCLLTWVPHHSFSDPGPRNDHCPCVNLRAFSVTLRAFAIQFSLFPRFPQYIDMKMIFSCSCILFAIIFVQLVQAEILSAAERAGMADVIQIKKIVPLIACEIPFCQSVCMSASWCLVSTYLI